MNINMREFARLVARVVSRFRGSAESTAAPQRISEKSWEASQDYELKNAIAFMEGDFFKSLFSDLMSGRRNVSMGYKDELLMREFFGDEDAAWTEFLQHITKKRVMEIGPCVASELASWDIAAERYIVEPLYGQIAAYQRKVFGTTCFEDLVCYDKPAEELIDELVGRIDGAVLVRNCLDHTPGWPFILSNIALYTTPRAYLLLWTDLYHHDGVDAGHYNLTQNKDAFRRLIENIGFRILKTYSHSESADINFGCLARRI